MNNARPYDLVIFDWEGTVMDSPGRIVSCMQLTIRPGESMTVPSQSKITRS